MREVLAHLRRAAIWNTATSAARHVAGQAGVRVAARAAETLVARASRRVPSPILLVIGVAVVQHVVAPLVISWVTARRSAAKTARAPSTPCAAENGNAN